MFLSSNKKFPSSIKKWVLFLWNFRHFIFQPMVGFITPKNYPATFWFHLSQNNNENVKKCCQDKLSSIASNQSCWAKLVCFLNLKLVLDLAEILIFGLVAAPIVLVATITCVILSDIPSMESLSSKRGSFLVPMNMGSMLLKWSSLLMELNIRILSARGRMLFKANVKEVVCKGTTSTHSSREDLYFFSLSSRKTHFSKDSCKKILTNQLWMVSQWIRWSQHTKMKVQLYTSLLTAFLVHVKC